MIQWPDLRELKYCKLFFFFPLCSTDQHPSSMYPDLDVNCGLSNSMCICLLQQMLLSAVFFPQLERQLCLV